MPIASSVAKDFNPAYLQIVPRRRTPLWVVVAIIAVAILATFGRIVTHDFVGGWDDQELIFDNPMIHPPTAAALEKIWTTPHARMYMPVVYSTWWLLAHVAAVGGEGHDATALNPYVYHAANLLVHLANALIVFAILRLLLRDDSPRSLRACALGALVFGLHPLQVEAAAWATGMKDVLSAMWALLAMWQYLQSAAHSGARRRWMHYSLATAMFALALLAKPSTVVVPLILLALDVLILRRPIRRVMLVLLPWLALSAIWAVVTAKVQPTPELTAPPVLHRFLIAADALGFYLYKLIWPARLGVDYGLRPDRIVHSAWWIGAAIALVAVLLFRRRWIVAGALVFVIGVLPVLGLTPFVFQWLSTTADRYVYLSMLGVAVVCAFAVARSRPIAVPWVLAGIVVVLAIRSSLQCAVWRDDRTLMTHELTINPLSPLANNYLGHLAFVDGRFGDARKYFEVAFHEKPDYLMARDNLAVALAITGEPDRAIDLMKQTLAMRRRMPLSIHQPINTDLSRLAAFLSARGRYAEAAGYLRELAWLSPDDANVQIRLAEAEREATTHPASATREIER